MGRTLKISHDSDKAIWTLDDRRRRLVFTERFEEDGLYDCVVVDLEKHSEIQQNSISLDRVLDKAWFLFNGKDRPFVGKSDVLKALEQAGFRPARTS